jgi:uncharacterized protein (DUF885 family)
MSLDRRQLLLFAAAAGLAGTAPASALAAPAAGDAALNAYFDALSKQILDEAPEQATYLGLDTGADAGRKSRLSDSSWAHVEHDRVWCREQLAKLATFPDAGLSPSARLNKGVVVYAMELGRDAAPFNYGDNTLASAMSESATPYVVSQQGGAYSAGPEFLDSAHKIETKADAEAYLARVHEIGRVMGQETDRIRRDAGLGVIAPDFILSNTIGQQEGILAVPAAQARLVSTLERKTREKGIAGDWAARCQAIVEKDVYPALSTQLATLKGLQPKSTHDAGVWRLPNGEAYYRWLLREGTSTSLTPEEVHQMGLEQNKAIEARMDGL